MIAQIIPLQRLPRHIEILDYEIPTEFEKSICIGQMARVPFRNSEIFGIIFDIQNSSHENNLKKISSLVHEVPFVSKNYLGYLHTISKIYGTPIGSVAKMGLLPLQKNKLTKVELAPLNSKLKKNSQKSTNYFLYQTVEEHKKLFDEINPKKTTVIIVPEVRHIEEVRCLLSEKLHTDITEWHSELSTKEKFSRWLEIRNGQKHIIIGTRGTLLLPFPQLEHLIIDFEHDKNLKHWDQSPRFHSKDLAHIVQNLNPSCVLTYASFSPSFDAYYDITKKNLHVSNKKMKKDKLLFDIHTDKNFPTIANISQQGAYDTKRIFSTQIEEKLETLHETRTKNVFIFINKLGEANLVLCKNCGHIENDPETGLPLIYKAQTKKLHAPYSSFSKPLPLTCATCNSMMIKMFGTGSESVEKEVKKLLGKNIKYSILRIDSDADLSSLSKTDKPMILIGTQMAFQYIDWNKTDLIIFLDIDRQLALPEYLATEQVWHMITETQFRRNNTSEFYIQTRNPEHILFKSMSQPDRLYRTELGKRQKLGYPPYMYLARFFYANSANFTAKQQCGTVYKNIVKGLTMDKKYAKLIGPFEMQPRFFRNNYWHGFLAKLSQDSWIEDVIYINKNLGAGWRIDPNPISLLSP